MSIHRPEQHDDWTILARGPSLWDCTQADVLDGPVVAVNGAIYHHAIPADYLASVDEPERWVDHNACNPPWGANPMPEGVAVRLLKWTAFRRRTGITAHPFPGGNGGGADIAMMIGDKRRDLNYHRWTTLLAIGWARWGGAKRIRLLGADMQGESRAYGCGGRILTEQRWAETGHLSEVKDYRKIVAACAAVGVEVERVVREPSR